MNGYSNFKRYRMRQEPDHTWTVFDIFTGVAVSVGASVAMGMEEEFAREVSDILNSAYSRGRMRA
ncbi:hypothetical protein CO657_36120 (plasmid) [Rhizobium acidisoli]|uniref:Uncharacterized protein n=1 Tax=Rhizobium acidisoli TaxID=1538158 RepID=A0AAE5WVC2_9HYPH|nr:hypothetical protein [Rhizobium acidisoli]KPH05106.1 hypothetical protein AOG23_29720 [Rhizobium acidisoli]QAS83193.1 hypothetical protein CO657_36120 [Rhizobium acidisoli]